MSRRFCFIPNSQHSGDLISMYFCLNCKCPKKFNEFCMIDFPTYPRADLDGPDQCFMCGASFDGNTPTFHVVIELTELKKEKNDERDANI